jgi:c(7)-type cytochrome triheme protein
MQMRNDTWRTRTLALTGATLVLAALAGGALPKLPAERALPQGTDSPGVVVFSHASHVDAARPDCTGCHPRLFSILHEATPTQGGPRITHKEMEAGRQCGACHDGKAAHGFEDCAACHRDK